MSVCLCVVILLSLELSKYLKLDVHRVLQGCHIGVSRVFQGSLWVFQGCFKHVSRVFQGYFKSVLRVFRECFMGVSRVHGCTKITLIVVWGGN